MADQQIALGFKVDTAQVATATAQTKALEGATAGAASSAKAASSATTAHAAAHATASTSIVASANASAAAAKQAAYKLQVFGQGLDDLQYVGEQGLRPIINNLAQEATDG